LGTTDVGEGPRQQPLIWAEFVPGPNVVCVTNEQRMRVDAEYVPGPGTAYVANERMRVDVEFVLPLPRLRKLPLRVPAARRCLPERRPARRGTSRARVVRSSRSSRSRPRSASSEPDPPHPSAGAWRP
jgi:hypothetical protein